MLRIDVNTNASYRIPTSNPFVSTPGAVPEIWAYGLRNPWRFSFDRATGDLSIGDVGQGLREEVDFRLFGDPGGENYGWRLYEGFLTNTCSVTFSNVPTTLPILDYTHVNGACAIIGGYRYRGPRIPRSTARTSLAIIVPARSGVRPPTAAAVGRRTDW